MPFGAHVQAFHEEKPKNTNHPRTIDCVYLRPLNNKQGGHELMNINTERKTTRPRVWELPVTDLIIQRIEELAAKDGIRSLKLTNRNKTIVYPSDWIAGVDYQGKQPQQQQQSDSEEEDSS